MRLLPRLLSGLLGIAALVSLSFAPAAIRIPLDAEKLTAPEGVKLPSYAAIVLVPAGGTRFDVSLAPAESAPRLNGLDLGLLVPRVPALARGDETLTRLALLQREFNRNEIHNVLSDGTDFSIANNCLERGLWEVKLARPEAGKTTTLFHAWFTFPAEEYARLFREINGGLDESRYDAILARYPGLGGFVLPLAKLRTPESEKALAPVDTHPSDPLDRLTEQKGKTRLVRTAHLSTYADVARASSQPVTLAKFSAPGLYDPKESMTFDMTWLARPEAVVWRKVEVPRGKAAIPEIELRFANGVRILAADPKFATLPARAEPPAVEADVLKLVCGIGTPVIHAPTAERAAEIAEDRPRYLLLLDATDHHVDNHFTGVDGVYVWREAGNPGRLHLWLVSYERIALIAHYSAPWPG